MCTRLSSLFLILACLLFVALPAEAMESSDSSSLTATEAESSAITMLQALGLLSDAGSSAYIHQTSFFADESNPDPATPGIYPCWQVKFLTSENDLHFQVRIHGQTGTLIELKNWNMQAHSQPVPKAPLPTQTPSGIRLYWACA